MLVEFLDADKPWGDHVFIDPESVSGVENNVDDTSRFWPSVMVRERGVSRYWLVVGTPDEVAGKLGLLGGAMLYTVSESLTMSTLVSGEAQPAREE